MLRADAGDDSGRMLGKDAYGEFRVVMIRFETEIDGSTIIFEISEDIPTVDLLAALELFINECLARRHRGTLQYVDDDEL